MPAQEIAYYCHSCAVETVTPDSESFDYAEPSEIKPGETCSRCGMPIPEDKATEDAACILSLRTRLREANRLVEATRLANEELTEALAELWESMSELSKSYIEAESARAKATRIADEAIESLYEQKRIFLRMKDFGYKYGKSADESSQ